MSKKLKLKLESDISFDTYNIIRNPSSGTDNWLSGITKETFSNGIEETYEALPNSTPKPRYITVYGLAEYKNISACTDSITLTQKKHPNYYTKGNTYVVNDPNITSGTKSTTLSTDGGRIYIRSYAIVNGDNTQHSFNSDYFTISAGTANITYTQIGNISEKNGYVEWVYNFGSNTTYDKRSQTFIVLFDNKNGSKWSDTITINQEARIHVYTNPIIELLNTSNISVSGGAVNFNAYYTKDGEKKGLSSIQWLGAPDGMINYDKSTYDSISCNGVLTINQNTAYSIRTVNIKGTVTDEGMTGLTAVTSSTITQEAKPNDNYVFSLNNHENWLKMSTSNAYLYIIHETSDKHNVTFDLISTNNGENTDYVITIPTGSTFCSLVGGETTTDKQSFTLSLELNSGNDRTAIINLHQITSVGSEMTDIQIRIIQLDSAAQLVYKNVSSYTEFTHAIITVGMDFMTGEYIDLLANVVDSSKSYKAVGEESDTIFGVSSIKGDLTNQTLAWGGDNIEVAGNERIICTPKTFVSEMTTKSKDTHISISAKTTPFNYINETNVASNGIVSVNIELYDGNDKFVSYTRPINNSEQVYDKGTDNKLIKELCLTSQLNSNKYTPICDLVRYRYDGRWFIRQNMSYIPNYATEYQQSDISSKAVATAISGGCYFYSEDEDKYIGDTFSPSVLYGNAKALSTNLIPFVYNAKENAMKFASDPGTIPVLDRCQINYNRTKYRVLRMGLYNVKENAMNHASVDFTKLSVNDFSPCYNESSKNKHKYFYYKDYTSNPKCHIFFSMEKVNDLQPYEEESSKTVEKTIYLYCKDASGATSSDYMPKLGWSGTITDDTTGKSSEFTISSSDTRSYVRIMSWNDISNGKTTNYMKLSNLSGDINSSKGLENIFYSLGIQPIANSATDADYSNVVGINTLIKHASSQSTIRWWLQAPSLVHKGEAVTGATSVWIKATNLPSVLRTGGDYKIVAHEYLTDKTVQYPISGLTSLPTGLTEYKTASSTTYSSNCSGTSFVGLTLPTTSTYSSNKIILIAMQLVFVKGGVQFTVFHSADLNTYKSSQCYVTWNASIHNDANIKKQTSDCGYIYKTNTVGNATLGMSATNKNT